MPPVIKALAEAALAVLSRKGQCRSSGVPGELEWSFQTSSTDGRRFEIRCSGPDLPSTLPNRVVLPSEVPRDREWRGTHRLVVAPPIVTLDLSWRTDSPLRVFAFSRGDWEKELEAIARADEDAS